MVYDFLLLYPLFCNYGLFWVVASLLELQLLMKTLIHAITITLIAVFTFACPPKHEEPISSNLLVTSRSEHLVMGNPSGVFFKGSNIINHFMEKP